MRAIPGKRPRHGVLGRFCRDWERFRTCRTVVGRHPLLQNRSIPPRTLAEPSSDAISFEKTIDRNLSFLQNRRRLPFASEKHGGRLQSRHCPPLVKREAMGSRRHQGKACETHIMSKASNNETARRKATIQPMPQAIREMRDSAKPAFAETTSCSSPRKYESDTQGSQDRYWEPRT